MNKIRYYEECIYSTGNRRRHSHYVEEGWLEYVHKRYMSLSLQNERGFFLKKK